MVPIAIVDRLTAFEAVIIKAPPDAARGIGWRNCVTVRTQRRSAVCKERQIPRCTGEFRPERDREIRGSSKL